VIVPDLDVAAEVMAVIVDGELEPRFHDALHVCAIARTTTPELLSSVLAIEPASAFSWLAGRSFIDGTGGTVVPHEMVRQPLSSALGAINPERDRELRRRICDHHYRTAVVGDRSAVADLAHLVSNQAVRWGYRLQGPGKVG
jgi:hypothetical protein